MTAAPNKRLTRFAVIAGFLLATVAGLTLGIIGDGRRCTFTNKDSCLATLRQIGAAKSIWMIEHKKSTNDVPTWQDLVGANAFFTRLPQCPDYGTYTIGQISEPPTCSIVEHNDYYKKCMASIKASKTDELP